MPYIAAQCLPEIGRSKLIPLELIGPAAAGSTAAPRPVRHIPYDADDLRSAATLRAGRPASAEGACPSCWAIARPVSPCGVAMQTEDGH